LTGRFRKPSYEEVTTTFPKAAGESATTKEGHSPAASKGFKDAEHMKKDNDLAPLRERQDFQKIVRELEAGKNK
jgi:hypothetical protein